MPAGAGPADARTDLLRFLERRERTRSETVEHLRRRGHAAEAVAAEVSAAEAAGWLSDRRYAEIYLRDRRRLRPASARVALRELQMRGVAAEVARAALEGLDPPWDEQELAVAAVRSRWPRWPVAARRVKAAQFLARRGFAGGVVWGAVDQMERESAGAEPGIPD